MVALPAGLVTLPAALLVALPAGLVALAAALLVALPAGLVIAKITITMSRFIGHRLHNPLERQSPDSE